MNLNLLSLTLKLIKMKKIAIFTAFLLTSITMLSAQDEYRVSQPLSDSIDWVVIEDGWQVRIRHGEKSSLTIVTPCGTFFEEDNEPQISTVVGDKLTLHSNKYMPRSTVVEITLKHKLHYLKVEKGATVQTDNLMFYGSFADVDISEDATVTGKSWRGAKNLDVTVDQNATLRLDTLQAENKLTLLREPKARVDCPTLISADTKVKSDVKSCGSLYQTDPARNLTVKNVKRSFAKSIEGITFSIGLSSPVPLYMNNKSASPYNRGESYRICFQWGLNKAIPVGPLSFDPRITYELGWSRLLNSVSYNGNALVLNTPASGEIPQQHLYTESVGLRLGMGYSFGQKNKDNGEKPFKLGFGLDALYNFGGRLVTRTMGSDNRWDRTREKIDVMNPWQLRAFVNIGGGPLTRASLGLSYDLLPTFRSGTDADKIRTFGITLSF